MGNRQPTEIRKKQIARAAMNIIARTGLAGFTTAAVAGSVGISEGAMFRHVRNKEDIILLIVEELEQILFKDFPSQEEDPIKRLGLFVEQRIRLLGSDPAIIQLFFSEQLLQAAGPKGVERIKKLEQRSMYFVQECVEDASNKGLLRPGLAVSHVMLVVFGAIMATVNLEQHQGLEHLRDTDASGLWHSIEIMIRR